MDVHGAARSCCRRTARPSRASGGSSPGSLAVPADLRGRGPRTRESPSGSEPTDIAALANSGLSTPRRTYCSNALVCSCLRRGQPAEASRGRTVRPLLDVVEPLALVAHPLVHCSCLLLHRRLERLDLFEGHLVSLSCGTSTCCCSSPLGQIRRHTSRVACDRAQPRHVGRAARHRRAHVTRIAPNRAPMHHPSTTAPDALRERGGNRRTVSESVAALRPEDSVRCTALHCTLRAAVCAARYLEAVRECGDCPVGAGARWEARPRTLGVRLVQGLQPGRRHPARARRRLRARRAARRTQRHRRTTAAAQGVAAHVPQRAPQLDP